MAAVISTMSIGRGAQEVITSTIQSLGTNLLFVRPLGFTQEGAFSLTMEDASALVDPVFAPGVAAAAPEISDFGQVVAGRENTFGEVLGVTPEYETVRNYATASGQFITREQVATIDDAAVLGSRVAETLFGNRDPVGQTVRINGRQFTVTGILESRGGTVLGNLDGQVLVPITTAYYRLFSERTTQGGVAVSAIYVQVDELESMDEALQDIETVLRIRHRITGENDFIVTSQEEVIETLTETQETFVIFLGAIAGISLLVGGIGIMNIMMVSVTERTREIGVRKAMGARWRDVLFQFVTEATLLSFGGGVAGVLLGISLSLLMDGRSILGQTFQTTVSGDITVLALAVATAVGLFFGIYPAARAANLHPIEALRYE